jgi:hypothetical protein
MQQQMLRRLIVPFVLLIMAGSASAAGYGGHYTGETEPALTLRLQEAADGSIKGTLTEGGTSMPLSAHPNADGITGLVGPADQRMPFTATVEGDRLVIHIGPADESDELVFHRGENARAGVLPAGATRNVVINGKRLSDTELAQAENTYRIQIPDADYWYDPVLGAWGVRGGPTMGFIGPNLDLGGALQEDASGGGTNVVVNGRILHPQDLMALQQITGPILPGRYFITAQGLAGYEGGPPQWNLIALMAQSQGGGGSNTWQSRITGASGFSDGTTGAVFLPNGGIVSTGQ